MPNVFVPMHQPLLSQSQSPRTTGPVACYAACLLFSPRTSRPLVRVSALSVLAFLSDLKRGRCIAQESRMSGRGDESNRHQVCTFPIPVPFPPPRFPPFSFPLTLPPHPPLVARPRRSACFFNAKCSLLFVRVYGRFGREVVARPALFSNAKRALRTHPSRATWHLQGCPEQVSEQDSCVDW